MATISDKQQQLVDKLKELFMMDQADLNFGIYRVMNAKHDEIENFLHNDLLSTIHDVLQGDGKESDVKKELNEAIKNAQSLGVDPDSVPKVQELKALLGNGVENSLEKDEDEIFSQLTTFFSRYYDGGDFMSLRRYKRETYSPLPMNGEEVKLHWANADQYYIKSAENFSHYAFTVGDKPALKHICFELVDASTEQNNVKATEDKERRFILNEANPITLKQTNEGEELLINFSYQADAKKRSQKDLNQATIKFITELEENDALLTDINDWATWQAALLTLSPTDKNKTRTILEKHLNDYTAKNSFDYFIHKDLGGFMRRELDFFIKNELLLLDDIVPSTVDTIDKQLLSNERSLKKVIAFKVIAQKLIAFLAQLEDFQKKMWLKKKFVLETNYSMTLDRVPESFYAEIVANDKQVKEWLALGFIESATKITEDYLKENPYLLIDTGLFDPEFKQQLLAEIDDLDGTTDGLLIHSENFQALNLLQERYREQVKCIYIDPPYNTNASEIIYKNSYKHSSWMSLLQDRVKVSRSLLSHEGIHCLTIDDVEFHRVKEIIENIYHQDNTLGVACIKNNPSGRSTANGFSIAHEYAIFSSKQVNKHIGRLGRDAKQVARYKEKDEIGSFEWVNFRKHGGVRSDAPTMFYPIFISKDSLRIPEVEWDGNNWNLLEQPSSGEVIILPIDENGKERRWKWGIDRIKNDLSEFSVRKDKNSNLTAYVKSRMNEEGMLPLTWWDKKEYSATSNGTNLLKDIFGNLDNFSYPKSLYAVIDSLRVSTLDSTELVLDYFGGSGTTAHATISLNREDNGGRKYNLVEMGDHFDKVLKPRIKKITYAENWKNGKPIVNKGGSFNGISHCFKTLRLESYEDVMDNLKLQRSEHQDDALAKPDNKALKEDYLLHYMLDVEAKESLLPADLFVDPFNASMRVVRENEARKQSIDLVETFNYLLGLRIKTIRQSKGIVEVTGVNPNDQSVLILWRNTDETDNDTLDDWFKKQSYNSRDMEFDLIYVNGDNNLPNLRQGEETWKVQLIDEVFQTLMFDVKDV